MALLDFFTKDVETRDKHPKSEYRSHYYKCEYKKAKEAILNYLRQEDYHVSNVNDNFGEIFVEQRRFHMIISIKKAAPLTVSVDVKVVVYGLIGAYKPRKIITELYKHLDKTLPFTKVG